MKKLEKITELKNGDLLFAYWANNAGRGRDNCTLQIVPAGTTRAQYSKDNKNVLAETRTSSWAGRPNLSKKVLDRLGISSIELWMD